MILQLSKDGDRSKFRSYCEYLLKRQADVEVKEKKHQRSLAQNRYLHTILAYFASEFGYGKKIVYLRSTRDLNTGEMTTAIDRWRNWCSSEAGLYIPEPNEYDALMEAEKQIALYEKYL